MGPETIILFKKVILALLYWMPLIINHILKSCINIPLIYRSASGDVSIFSLIAKFVPIFGVSMLALLWCIRKKIQQSKKLLSILGTLGITTLILVYIFLSCIGVFGEHLRDLFESALKIIGPCITDERDRIELSSLWSSMEKRELYIIIWNKVSEYAQKRSDVKNRYSRFVEKHYYEIAILGGNR